MENEEKENRCKRTKIVIMRDRIKEYCLREKRKILEREKGEETKQERGRGKEINEKEEKH